MRWKDIFDLAVKLGRENDIRNIKIEDKYQYNYSDSKILYGSLDEKINKLFVDIDIGVGEVLLVKELINCGMKIDGIISHHPHSIAAYNISEVAEVQKYNWIEKGVSKKIAEKLLLKATWKESIKQKAKNHLRTLSAVKLLNIPFMCIHTPIDNVVQIYFEKILEENKVKTLNEVYGIISRIPECVEAARNGDNPFIINEGLKDKPVGNYIIDMTGGINPPPEIFYYLKKANLKTIIGMHYKMENIEAILNNNLTAVICGHMASDSIGLNIFCDKLVKNGIEIVHGLSFYRHKRTGK